MNAIADMLSQNGQILLMEWSFYARVVQFHQWGTLLLELFATHLYGRCPLFVYSVLEPQAVATDSLSKSWDYPWLMHIHPTRFWPKSYCIRESNCHVIYSLAWLNQFWFSDLLTLVQVPPFPSPSLGDGSTFSTAIGGTSFKATIASASWLLSDKSYVEGVFSLKPPVGYKLPRANIHWLCTRAIEKSLLISVAADEPIHSLPLTLF